MIIFEVPEYKLKCKPSGEFAKKLRQVKALVETQGPMPDIRMLKNKVSGIMSPSLVVLGNSHIAILQNAKELNYPAAYISAKPASVIEMEIYREQQNSPWWLDILIDKLLINENIGVALTTIADYMPHWLSSDALNYLWQRQHIVALKKSKQNQHATV